MSLYHGPFAYLYDLFYGEKNYAQEADFLHALWQRHGMPIGGKLLDVACGTGKHAKEFEQRGYHILGVDQSADMIEVARTRSSARAQFAYQNMKRLDVPAESFDGVSCLFDSIGFLLFNDDILAALRGMHAALKPGGLLTLEYWHGAAMLRGFDPVRVRRWQTERGTVLRISETTLALARQTATVRYQILLLNKDGTYETFQEDQMNRFFLLQEMNLFLTRAGFEPIEAFAGYHDRPVEESAWHIVTLARKRTPEPHS